MRPCTRRIASAEGNIKATSLDAALVEHAPWCRAAPNALLMRIKPLTWSNLSRGWLGSWVGLSVWSSGWPGAATVDQTDIRGSGPHDW